MAALEYRTAGESHGPSMVCLVEGLPLGTPIDLEFVNAELRRRQQGYGRGARQRIESDAAEVLDWTSRGHLGEVDKERKKEQVFKRRAAKKAGGRV